MNLLLFFAIPVATILLAIVWQKIIRSPFLVAATAFAIFLIVVYAIDSTLLIYAIVYTLLAFISAYIADLFYKHGSNFFYSNLKVDNIDTSSINTSVLNTDEINNRR